MWALEFAKFVSHNIRMTPNCYTNFLGHFAISLFNILCIKLSFFEISALWEIDINLYVILSKIFV